jgi:hypothetical protein
MTENHGIPGSNPGPSLKKVLQNLEKREAPGNESGGIGSNA